ncbi:unnamed protein product [Vitrella brassicaformis CCMP3155]|uniref:Uncharacterized protein n=1 Tax=Vitrella brassicaformis (strain CCMP3155) TaxID=1169540 RepID=A0A0G4GTQ2_VITBC|nr:unnamed protein product [Vitrella brassicaformis CCMP3155]|eukprot:CEM34146.1 unnamed protein product [Vitrella brassicaformis CCMP3155]
MEYLDNEHYVTLTGLVRTGFAVPAIAKDYPNTNSKDEIERQDERIDVAGRNRFPRGDEVITAGLRSTKVGMAIDLGNRTGGGKLTGRATLTPSPLLQDAVSTAKKRSLFLEGVRRQPWDVCLVRPDSQQPMHSLPLAEGAEHYVNANRLTLPTQAISDAMQVREPFEDGQGRQRGRGAGEVLEVRQGAVEAAVELYYRDLSLDELGITILEDTPMCCNFRLEFPPPAADVPYDVTATQQLALRVADVLCAGCKCSSRPSGVAAARTRSMWRLSAPTSTGHWPSSRAREERRGRVRTA